MSEYPIPLVEETLKWCRNPWAESVLFEETAMLHGTLKAFCEAHELNYMMMYKYIYVNPGRAEKYKEALQARKDLHKDLVLENMVNAATLDPRNLIKNIHKPSKWTRAEAKSITSYKAETEKSPAEVKFTPVHQATESLAKHLGMFTDKVELTGADGGPVEVADAMTNETARRVAFLLSKANCST